MILFAGSERGYFHHSLKGLLFIKLQMLVLSMMINLEYTNAVQIML
jgi:hypothetical protein